MALTDQISDGFERVAQEFNSVSAQIPRVDLVTKVKSRTPYYIGHRGAHLLYPENSMEGFRAVGRSGFPVEPDLQALSDGTTLVALHDSTVDRTMTGTGTVASKTLAQWRALRIKPQLVNGPQAMPVIWDDILDEMGGRYLLVPELKDAPQAAVDGFIDSIVSRGLQRAVIVQSYTYAYCVQAAAAGISTLYLGPSGIDGPTALALAADGIEFIGLAYTAGAPEIAAIHAAGMQVVTHTVNTVTERDAQIAKGVDGMFTDDPWHISGRYAPSNRAPFQTGDAWPHLSGHDGGQGYLTGDTISNRYIISPPNGLRRINGTQAGTVSIEQGWAGTRGPHIRIRATVTFMEDSIQQDRWCGFYFGTVPAPDDSFIDGAARTGQNGYHFLYRRTGELNIYKVGPTGTTQLASIGSAVAANAGSRSQPQRLEIAINATSVSIVNYNANVGTNSSDTTWRGQGRFFLTSNGTGVEFTDVSIIDE